VREKGRTYLRQCQKTRSHRSFLWSSKKWPTATCLWSQNRRCTAGTCFPLIEWTRATNFHQFDSLFILHWLTDVARGAVACKVKYDPAHLFIADQRFSFGIIGRPSTPIMQMTVNTTNVPNANSFSFSKKSMPANESIEYSKVWLLNFYNYA
jgi:hypothetical protein